MNLKVVIQHRSYHISNHNSFKGLVSSAKEVIFINTSSQSYLRKKLFTKAVKLKVYFRKSSTIKKIFLKNTQRTELQFSGEKKLQVKTLNTQIM